MPLSERGAKETNIIMASIKQAMSAPTTNAVERLLIIGSPFFRGAEKKEVRPPPLIVQATTIA
jgi:hypothetical protein